MEDGQVRAKGSPLELDRKGVSLFGHILDETQRGRTARERWQLVKLVSRIGVQLKQRNLVDGTWRADHIVRITILYRIKLFFVTSILVTLSLNRSFQLVWNREYKII